MNDDPPIFVIGGQLAAGTSSVARAILQRIPDGVCVDIDEIRGLVASGLDNGDEDLEATAARVPALGGG